MGGYIDLVTHILPIKGEPSIHYLLVYIAHSEKRKERKEADKSVFEEHVLSTPNKR